tara:strand:+ start:342 stop:1139 length:798 start_codon:yes stop_codon:yes gene_type:complete
MSFGNYIHHTGIITIPRNKNMVREKMIPNLESKGINNINIYVFDENKTGCQKNNGDTTFSIKDLYNIKNDQGKNSKICNDLCKNLCENHLYIIKQAKKLNSENVMIFEDDARFIDNLTPSKITRIIGWMNTHSKWDVLFLGAIAFPYPIILPVSRDIGKCNFPTEAHAYILSKKGIDKMCKMKEKNHFDFMLQKYLDNKFICVPSICNQNKSPAMFETLSKKFKISPSVENYTRLKNIHNTISIIIPFIIIISCIILSSIVFNKL